MSLFFEILSVPEAVGAFWLGYVLYNFLKTHPKIGHLDEEHLFMWSAIPVAALMFVIMSNFIFVFAIAGAGWFAMTIMGIKTVLFCVGLAKIIHYCFKFAGKSSQATLCTEQKGAKNEHNPDHA